MNQGTVKRVLEMLVVVILGFGVGTLCLAGAADNSRTLIHLSIYVIPLVALSICYARKGGYVYLCAAGFIIALVMELFNWTQTCDGDFSRNYAHNYGAIFVLLTVVLAFFTNVAAERAAKRTEELIEMEHKIIPGGYV